MVSLRQHQFPSTAAWLSTLAIMAIYLLATALCIGLRSEHVLITVLFLTLYFASDYTRKLAVALLPFIIFAVSYDWMRLCPNYTVNAIDVKGLHDLELSLFGMHDGDKLVIPGAYFYQHHVAVADFLSGIFYLCWVPVPIAFGLYLFVSKSRKMYLHFSIAFLLINLIGFAGYYIHPAAPPWYTILYGFDPIINTPGNTAGLARFDSMTGLHIFSSIYGRNANVFAAVPSLHASYMVVTLWYAVKNRCKPFTIALFSIIMVGIWCTAVYSAHHYIIDVLLGIACALIGILLLEKGLMRISWFKKFIDKYFNFIR